MALLRYKRYQILQNYCGSSQRILDTALSDIEQYKTAGLPGIKLINDYDIPYVKPPLDPEASELFLQIAKKARSNFSGTIGIEVLEGDNTTALKIAHDAKLNFVRAHAYVFACVGSSGLFEGCAGELIRQRRQLGAEHIKIYADIKKKHCAHALTADLSIVDEAIQAQQSMADGLIITGIRTSENAKPEEVNQVKKASDIPIFVGSGLTTSNISDYFNTADGFIIGSHFREEGNFLNPLSPTRLSTFMDKYHSIQ